MGTSWMGSERFERVGNIGDTIIVTGLAAWHETTTILHTHAPLDNGPRRTLQKDIISRLGQKMEDTLRERKVAQSTSTAYHNLSV